ncbi:TetR/AcrR family transcriptional regulator [Aestuariicella hydrocarbonica]|uniref:TetR/AcrR family transcriptional regulator n=1 Tax=Pseudomaricurvus hydrocarbonicus TaxID=1470433 RepID=A0A9E5MMR1_9GAMM|nr:TetR/AcrR family transcriptional regulator [Aestuariicella hydrocarbonica]NHO67094.1 TetR/AcrR family transcriptional regulator [Aestuariicella hydrocarbonica]
MKSPRNGNSPSTRTRETRKSLRNSLLTLLEEKTFEQIIVREITTRASVGYATFFRHYKDKDALLNDLAAQEIHKLLTMTLPILYSVDSMASAQALCSFVWEHRKLWKTLLTGGASSIVKEEYLSQALGLAKEQAHPDA